MNQKLCDFLGILSRSNKVIKVEIQKNIIIIKTVILHQYDIKNINNNE